MNEEKEEFISRCSKLLSLLKDLTYVEQGNDVWIAVMCVFISDICLIQEDIHGSRQGALDFLNDCFDEYRRQFVSFYHYTECGLSNVYLANGFNVIETPEGKAVSVNDIEALHSALGLNDKYDMPSISSSWKIKNVDKKICAIYQIT